MTEIEDLFEMHEDITEKKVGKPAAKVAVLNKAGLVLVCAFWQSYCEEILFEILGHYKSGKSADVPKALRTVLGERLLKKSQPEYAAAWRLTAKGWATVIDDLIANLQSDTARPLDSPTSENVNKVFKKYLGVSDLSKKWRWPGMTYEQAVDKLDEFIKRRHRLAHRGADTSSVSKLNVRDFANHVKRLAEKTESLLISEDFIA